MDTPLLDAVIGAAKAYGYGPHSVVIRSGTPDVLTTACVSEAHMRSMARCSDDDSVRLYFVGGANTCMIEYALDTEDGSEELPDWVGSCSDCDAIVHAAQAEAGIE